MEMEGGICENMEGGGNGFSKERGMGVWEYGVLKGFIVWNLGFDTYL